MSEIPTKLDRIACVTSRGKSKWDFLAKYTGGIDTRLDSFDQLINQVNDVKMALRETGCFNKVNVIIDTSAAYSEKSDNGVQVVFELDEKRLNLSTNTGMDIDKANPNTSFNLTLPNVFGRGETISFQCGREVTKYEKFRGFLPNIAATFNKQCLDGKTSFLAELKHDYVEREWSNVSEENMTGQVSLRYQLSDDISVRLASSSRLVNMLGLSSAPVPLSLREQFGYAKKNALNLEAVYDGTLFDGGVVPASGVRAKLIGEVSPGHMKSVVDVASYYTLFNMITAKVSGQMGHINATTTRPVHYCDRFFLGGMSGSLRGFKKCSIGEYKDGCALGGTTYWSLGAHLYSRIDFLSKVTGGVFQNYLSTNIGIHAFAEAGNVTASLPAALAPNQHLAASYGVGFAFALNPQVQFELNYCQRAKGDEAKFKPGWNGGFSISI